MGRISRTASALVLTAGLPLAAVACGDSSGGGGGGADVEAGRPEDFEASPDYLASAIDDSQGLPHRYEIAMDFEVGPVSMGGDEPVATGAFDGERTQMAADFAAMFEDMGLPDELTDADLSMEIVTDATTSYVRAPVFATMADQIPSSADTDDLGPQAAMFDIFDDIGDGWAKVDLAAVQDVPRQLGNLIGAGQNFDPAIYLDIVRGTDDVEELGSENVGVDTVFGLAAEVSLQEMMEAQGLDPEEALGELPADVAANIDDFTFDVEVWIDSEARVRQVLVDMGDAVTEIVEESGEDVPGGDFEFEVTIEFSDYGDESIAVDVPTDAVDITDQVLVLVEEMDD